MNPSTRRAVALVDALVRSGVREVVLCPGSRSSAVAYAVWAAEQRGDLRLHVRVDERSAGFLALGLAKVSRCPAVVVTTSGTAVANLHPAVLEAHHARVPLLVLSTDRPAALRGTGANQTTVQPGIFGSAVRFAADVAADAPSTEGVSAGGGVCVGDGTQVGGGASVEGGASVGGGAHVDVGAGADVDAAVVRAAVAACTTTPGPVHLNVQFAEPLVPDDLADLEPQLCRSIRKSTASPGNISGANQHFSGSSGKVEVSAGGRSSQGGAEGRSAALHPPLPARTVVVLGDTPTLSDQTAVLAWAQREHLPVLAEPFGPHPRPAAIRHPALVAGDEAFVAAHEPDAVVVVGRPTLSRAFTALVRRPERIVVADVGVEFDLPNREVERLPLADLVTACVADGDGSAPGSSDPAPGSIDPAADGDGSEPGSTDLAPGSTDLAPGSAGTEPGSSNSAPGTIDPAPASTAPDGGPSQERTRWTTAWQRAGEAAAGAITAGVDEDPSSVPELVLARTVADHLPDGALLFLGSSSTPRDLDLVAHFGQRVDVVASRGLAGIDGCVSTAVGLALAHPDRLTYAVLGDLTFLHDGNGLAVGPGEPTPDLTIVVVNDQGGGIFATLEPGEPRFAAAFERLFATPTGTDLAALCAAHRTVYEQCDDPAALASVLARRPEGLRVVELRLSRARRRQNRADLRARIAGALNPPGVPG